MMKRPRVSESQWSLRSVVKGCFPEFKPQGVFYVILTTPRMGPTSLAWFVENVSGDHPTTSDVNS